MYNGHGVVTFLGKGWFVDSMLWNHGRGGEFILRITQAFIWCNGGWHATRCAANQTFYSQSNSIYCDINILISNVGAQAHPQINLPSENPHVQLQLLKTIQDVAAISKELLASVNELSRTQKEGTEAFIQKQKETAEALIQSQKDLKEAIIQMTQLQK